MGMIITYLRIIVAVILCVVISHEIPDGCNGIAPEVDAPVPHLSPLFITLAALPEPLPQIALLWRTTSASCCVLSLALSIVQPHIAMLFFGYVKLYHIHHTLYFVLGIIRTIIGLIIPYLMSGERRIIINMLTAVIDFLGRLKRPLTEEEKRAKEASRKYVYARPPTCRCPPEQCTCEPVRIRVKRVNTLRGTLKWFRRWLEENQQDPLLDVPSIGTVIKEAQSQQDSDINQPATETSESDGTKHESTDVEESKKNV